MCALAALLPFPGASLLSLVTGIYMAGVIHTRIASAVAAATADAIA